MLKLRGVLCPLATPFDHRGGLYKTKIRHNVSRLELTKVSGFVVGSSWGEGELLSVTDRQKLWDLVLEASAGNRVLLADVSADGSAEAAALSALANEAGYAAAWAGPHRTYASPGIQLMHFRAIADASPLPVIVECSASTLSPDEAARLAEHPNVTAICSKDAPLDHLAGVVSRDDCSALTSRIEGVSDALAGGAGAAVLSLANVLPFHLSSIEEAVRMREVDAARDLERRLSAIDGALTSYGVPGLKHAMDLRGYFGGVPRLPLTPLRPAAKAEIEAALDGLQS